MKKDTKKRDVLLYAAPYFNADMRWFTHFACGDPLLAFTVGKKRIAAITVLEMVRFKKESRFDVVLDMNAEMAALRESVPDAGPADLAAALIKRYGGKAFMVPPDFPAAVYDKLLKLGIDVVVGGSPFFPNRVIKTAEEIQWLREGNRASCAGFRAVERVLKESTINRAGYVVYQGRVLTSERLRLEIEKACLDFGGINLEGVIAAAGVQGTDCHCAGFGPIKANELIVCDIFPRITGTGYWGDMTRTYLKGKASPAQKKLVADVKKAHDRAMANVKPGAICYDIHMDVVNYFKELGYKTEIVNGVPTGFFHGLGHGVGLDVHEAPNLGGRAVQKTPLKENMVVTIEPGLYYPEIGGCRIEDSCLVTADGCEPLAKHPYKWEIA
ncbi:MAG: Xaa-Pro peptidase family protein [Opitutales bacterium]|nr:Xaa-Pro peptidase family protein [Opitutales bacterium]